MKGTVSRDISPPFSSPLDSNSSGPLIYLMKYLHVFSILSKCSKNTVVHPLNNFLKGLKVLKKFFSDFLIFKKS